MKQALRFLSVLVFFLLVSPVYAMTTRGGDRVTVPVGEVIHGTLFAGGNNVAIEGTVDGDVFCGGQQVTISGTVNGDVICGGQTIRIEGTVSGSLRAGGQLVDIAGTIGRNVTVGGQTLTLEKSATVAGEVLFAGQTMSNLSGVTNITEVTPKPEKKTSIPAVTKTTKKTGGLIGKIIFYLIVAFILYAVAPKWTKKVLTGMSDSPVQKGLVGFLALMAGAFVILVTALTIIGIPLAVLAAILYGMTIVVSEVLVTIYIGNYLLDRFMGNRKHQMYKNILVGVPVSLVAFAVPVLGGLASFLGVIWGLGTLIQSRKNK